MTTRSSLAVEFNPARAWNIFNLHSIDTCRGPIQIFTQLAWAIVLAQLELSCEPHNHVLPHVGRYVSKK